MDKYNDKRKDLLMAIDQGEKVSDLALGMYDLTPYFNEDISKSLAEKIMYINNECRQVGHVLDKKICFAPQQEEALNNLEKYNKCILSAPTSFGKTLIIKEYIYKTKPKNIIYIVPTNALAYELENSFKSNQVFSDYRIFDRTKSSMDTNEKNAKLLFIGTQEKYLEIRNSIVEKIDLFVIDEAYKLEETTKNQRAYKLSETFLDSIINLSKKVFLLSPNANFIGFEKYEFQILEYDYNSVDKVYKVIDKSNFYNVVYEKASDNKTIVYFDSPNDINESIDNFQSISKENNNEFIEFLEREYHPEWSVIKLLKKGILVHHGQMPKYIQNKMMNLFISNKNYNLLLGTQSISEGINTPCKNMFIHMSCKAKKMQGLLLKNTIGRAGRLGVYPIGHIFSTENIEELTKNKITVSLSISKDEELKEIEQSNDESAIDQLCKKYNIEKEFYENIRKKYHFSLNIISKILEELQNDLIYSNFSSLPYIAVKIFDEYRWAYIDSKCICGVLQYYYYEGNVERYLQTYDDKIKFYRFKDKKNKGNKKTDTEIMDYYMRFLYSSLENYIVPIANIGYEIFQRYSDWMFGKNVIECIKNFIDRYNKMIIGIRNYEAFTDEQKIILQTLRDYGIIINNNTINHEMIAEIESRLNIRYSTYDIIRAINYLAINSKNNTERFLNIKKRYID